MPLGASITWGTGSGTGNGYRQFLLDALSGAGYSVDYVGSQTSGDMADPENEGFPGKRIEEVQVEAEKDVPNYLPNVYTINAGTNDCLQDWDVDSAGVRTNDLLNYLWSQTPDAVVVLSTLVNNLVDGVEPRVEVVNEQIRGLIWDLANNQGKKVILAEMHGDDGPTVDDINDDGIHPNDVGFQKMSDIWFRTIQQASDNGWIQPAP